MPRGDKSSYTGKQKRKAQHIEEGYEARGVSTDEAERRAWATVNKQDGGGRAKRASSTSAARAASAKNTSGATKRGPGRPKRRKNSPAKKSSARKSTARTSTRKTSARKTSARRSSASRTAPKRKKTGSSRAR